MHEEATVRQFGKEERREGGDFGGCDDINGSRWRQFGGDI